MGNLQLLEGLPNEEKLDKDFSIWLEETFQISTIGKTYVDNIYEKTLHTPEYRLSFENSEEFFNRRNDLILQELRKALLAS
jgi:hypothetical protein